MKLSIAIFLTILFLSSAISAIAGPLEEFEESITRPAVKASHSLNVYEHEVAEGVGHLISDLIVLPMTMGVVYGGNNSWDLIHAGRKDADGNTTLQPRTDGDALLPFFRFDGVYHRAEDEISAFDLRGEVGYGPVGFQSRYTEYKEDHSSDTLSTSELHLLYRMTFGSHVEIDLGMGGMRLKGEDTTNDFSFTTPLLIHPSDHYGFEFRPAWAVLNGQHVSDYDLSVLLGGPGVSLKIGYRWLLSETRSLSGPEVGFAVRW